MADKKGCWDNEDCDHGPQKDKPFFEKHRFTFGYFVAVLLGLMIFNALIGQKMQDQRTIPYSEFKERIRNGEISRVEIGGNYYIGMTGMQEGLQDRASFVYRTVPVEDPGFVPLLEEKGVDYYAIIQQEPALLNLILGWLLPLLVLVVLWRFMFKRMGDMGSNVMSFGKNKSIIVAEGSTGVTFDDVAGADEAKEELVEVVDFLKSPEKYLEIGGKIPKGILLVGPPGTGKTLLARAVAGNAGVPFFRMSGADFVEMFVGVGAARVRDLFKQARGKAPCIIFIDELDAIGKSRVNAMGGNDERETTLNQLLVEMDGFDASSGVIILAATNRPEILDPALLRPGRFDRQVLVDRPDVHGREQILKIHSKNVKLGENVDLQEIARLTPGFVGADLANIVNEAALLAVRRGRKTITTGDFKEAIEKVVAGLEKKSKLINPQERRTVAYHETGHALVAAFTPGSDPVSKISIVPRGFGALGYTLQTPTEDRYLLTQEELLGKIDVLLGGRAAEELSFGMVSTGAANDLSRATDISRSMITEYGMSERFKNVALSKRSAPMLGTQDPYLQREYAESTQTYIDEEISRMINERYRRVKNFLDEKRDLLEKVSAQLLEKEVLEREEFFRLIGREKEVPSEQGKPAEV
jgi:cell division protease FtsH